LYRDTHAWCPYCHKVWLQLEQKQVPYKVIKVNMNCYGAKSKEFLKLTPRGLLPAVEIDGEFFTESSRIMSLIEDYFPERPLTPAGNSARRSSDELMQLERAVFGAWLHWLRGENSSTARAEFETMMDFTDSMLSSCKGPFFMGDSISLVDCVFASSLERIAASVLYYKGLKVKSGRWRAVNEWFQAMEGDSAYRGTQSDFHTHVHDLPPQIGGCLASGTAQQQQAAAEIDGRDGSWQLPLPPLTADSLEPGEEHAEMDRAEAAAALVHCHEGCVRSSLAGTHAGPNVEKDVDAAFKAVAAMLLSGNRVEPEGLRGSEVADCLRYTRDRICVPRDMSFPAARQLRAHLNWIADAIDPRPSGEWRGTRLPERKRLDMDPAVFHGESCL